MPVRTLDYRQAARFWGLDDPELAFLVHAIVGGTPAYRTDMIRWDAPFNRADFDGWVSRAILSPGSPMFLEARYLLAERIAVPVVQYTAVAFTVMAAGLS